MSAARAILVEGASVEIFSSVDRLVEYVEPIDVSNSEYECFTTEGKELRLSVAESGPWLLKFESVKAELVDAPHKQEQYRTILRDHLVRHGVGVPDGARLDEIAALIPPSIVMK